MLPADGAAAVDPGALPETPAEARSGLAGAVAPQAAVMMPTATAINPILINLPLELAEHDHRLSRQRSIEKAPETGESFNRRGRTRPVDPGVASRAAPPARNGRRRH